MKAELRFAFSEGGATVIIGLNLCPVILAPTVIESRLFETKLTPFNCFSPGLISETKPLCAIDEATTFVVVPLNCIPVIKFSWHAMLGN